MLMFSACLRHFHSCTWMHMMQSWPLQVPTPLPYEMYGTGRNIYWKFHKIPAATRSLLRLLCLVMPHFIVISDIINHAQHRKSETNTHTHIPIMLCNEIVCCFCCAVHFLPKIYIPHVKFCYASKFPTSQQVVLSLQSGVCRFAVKLSRAGLHADTSWYFWWQGSHSLRRRRSCSHVSFTGAGTIRNETSRWADGMFVCLFLSSCHGAHPFGVKTLPCEGDERVNKLRQQGP